MTRVAVVSGSPVLRAGLRALLGAEAGMIVVGALGEREAGEDPAPLGAAVRALEPDVVVWAPDPAAGDDVPGALDALDVPDVGEATDRAPPRPPVVVLLDRADGRQAERALRAGARAVLPLDADAETVLAATRAAAAGLVAVPRALAARLVELVAASDPGVVPDDHAVTPLTPREREVLALLAQGLVNKQVAARLGITEHTVKAHVAAIYEKLHAGNRAAAVVAAARRGWLLL